MPRRCVASKVHAMQISPDDFDTWRDMFICTDGTTVGEIRRYLTRNGGSLHCVLDDELEQAAEKESKR